MQVVNKKVSELIPYENNPRINEEAVTYVANSIKEFGFKVPIIVDKNNVIVAGHTRLKAAEKLGLEEVPTIVADDLNEEQIKAFRLADNKVSEFSQWDLGKLEEELNNITGVDMEDFGFINDNFDDIEIENQENPYTMKVKIPQYEMHGEMPEIFELINTSKTNELLDRIEKSNVSDEQKIFLKQAAQRHLQFDYSKIAEYYAHQDKEMQELMEDSALVIIDINDAIANGYVELSSTLEEMLRDEA